MEQEIKNIICEAANIPGTRINPESMLAGDLLIDSLVFIKIITQIEEYFNINFPDDLLELQDDVTYEEFCGIVEGLL